MIRIGTKLLLGGASAYAALVAYRAWEIAARNSASPGAIVLLAIAGFAGLFALMAWTSAAMHLRRRSRS